jgi:SRSO17 transposase
MHEWATDAAQVAEWHERLDNLLVQVDDVFPRADLRRRAQACVRGLLGPLSRKNRWQLAEYAGWGHPRLQQHLLDRARWNENELRDRVRDYVMDHLADGAGAVLVLDQSGVAKKGHTLAGVAPLRCTRRGLSLPGGRGGRLGHHAWPGVDRAGALYLPRCWTDDRERCRRAHVPDEVGFATKPAPAQKIIERIPPCCPEGTRSAPMRSTVAMAPSGASWNGIRCPM